MLRLKDGTYLNLDLIQEFSITEFSIGKFIISYWDINSEEEEISGLYDTEEEAQKELDKMMGFDKNA